MLETLAPSLRHVVRRLLRAPLFTAVAILTLGVGIGANAAIFSLVYGVLLRPLPFEHPETLVGVWHEAPGLNIELLNQSPATYLTYREEGRAFEDIAMWDDTWVAVTGRQEPERVEALRVTDGLLPLLRVQPVLGRGFTAEDDSPAGVRTTILSYAYWQRRFGGVPDVIGQPLLVEGIQREIIGVLPASFSFLRSNAALLLPFRIDRSEVFVGNFSYQGIARLKPGVTIEQANRDVARMIPLLMEKFPLPPGFSAEMLEEARMGPKVRPLADDVIGDVGRVLWVLLGTVGVVLLIACANVANLFLVRAEGRQQELAIRSAMGASRRRVAGELLSESVMLGLVGGAVGLGLASLGIRLLLVLRPEGLPRLDEVGLDPIVMLFTLAIAIGAGLLFGLIPVLRFSRPHLGVALKEGGRGSSDGKARHRARTALVTAEIALALVLLVAAGLMLRTFQALRHVEPGFVRPEEVLTTRVSIPEAIVEDPEQSVRTHQEIMRRISQIPGVTAVGLSSSITMDGSNSWDPIFVEAFPGPGGQLPPVRKFKWVSPEFFETMGNPLLAGRNMTWIDCYAMASVAMVNEAFAREYWEDPTEALGKRIRQNPKDPWREIVGIVGNERDDGVAQPAPAIVYWPLLQLDFWDPGVRAQRWLGYAIRSQRLGSPTFFREIQEAVWSVNPSVPISNVRTLETLRADSMAQTSFALVLLAVAAGVALLLSIVGIYGVIAYAATQRTREIGIRMALGARHADVRDLFVRHGLMLTVVGIGLGLAAAAGLSRLMSALLFGISPLDPLTYGAVALGLALTALLASYVPARRAARVDPMVALRTGL